MRIRFLPADPQLTVVRLDSEAEEWLSKPRPSPYGGAEPELGRSKRATSTALVRFDSYRDDQGWSAVVGLQRAGRLRYGRSIAEHRGNSLRSASTSRGAHLASGGVAGRSGRALEYRGTVRSHCGTGRCRRCSARRVRRRLERHRRHVRIGRADLRRVERVAARRARRPRSRGTGYGPRRATREHLRLDTSALHREPGRIRGEVRSSLLAGARGAFDRRRARPDVEQSSGRGTP